YIPQHYYSRSCLDPSFFFFHATSTLDTYPFSLPDALPISRGSRCGWRSATSRISERSSGRRNAASPPLSAVPPDASSRARSSRTGSRPSPSSPPPTPTGSTPTCEHPAYTDQLTGPFTIAVKAFTLDLTLSKHRSPGGASRSEFDREDRPRDDVIDRAIAAAHSRRRTGSRSRRPAPPPQAHVAPKQTPQGLADAGPDDPEGVIYNPHPADSEYIYR